MYELRQVGARTYYIDCPARIGIFLLEDGSVCLIDSGNDKSAGKMVLKILDAQGWSLKVILNTHSHADHVGGNALLQERTGCKIYSVGTEPAFICMPRLEPAFLLGGFADGALRNKFVQAHPSVCEPLTEETLPAGLELRRLDGHAGSQAAYKTPDGVWFVGDAVVSEETLNKYSVSYIFDPRQYLESLDVLETLEGKLFIPSHAEPVTDIHPLAELNRQKVHEIRDFLLHVCREPQQPDDLIKVVFDHFGLKMNRIQHAMIGSTIRSHVGTLADDGLLHAHVEDNRLYWQTAEASHA